MIVGARGEVGSALCASFESLGHTTISVSSAQPVSPDGHCIDFALAEQVIGRGEVDLLINASGRGDRRASMRSGREATQALAGHVSEAGVPAVLISTTRVLEGYEGQASEDSPPRPTTEYARANAENEEAWLRQTHGQGSVLRIANFFTTPLHAESPQVQLLPWSLLTEAVACSSIQVRSGPSATKEFVSALDAAQAALTICRQGWTGRTVSTNPGCPMTLRELAEAATDAIEMIGKARPTMSFGADTDPFQLAPPGALVAAGWKATLSLAEVQLAMQQWLMAGMGHEID